VDVYLVQHGRPLPKTEDPERPLSAQGIKDVQNMAVFLKEGGVKVEVVFHSGKTRAKQTAERIMSVLNPGSKPQEMRGLSPLDDPEGAASEIERRDNALMIVGHLPHLSKLTSLLITGDPSKSIVSFQQGGVVCLRRAEDASGWTMGWMVVPELLKP
jgi:phosphohistidine phosphatase